MRRLAVLFLFLLPLSGWAGIWVPSSPETLGEPDTILFVPATAVKVSYLTTTPGVLMEPYRKAWEIQSPTVLKGRVGKVVRLTFTANGGGIPPLATNYLIFLNGTG